LQRMLLSQKIFHKREEERMSRVVPVKYLNREPKAEMIYNILEHHLGFPPPPCSVLDIGCGNGDICHYFLQKGFSVYGVDVEDCRRADNRNFDFQLVSSERISKEDACFDIILSNQVIEHVNDQALHLREIRRLLRPGGLVYFATPNKSSPFMQGHKNNNKVLSWSSVRRLLRRHGFVLYDYGVEVASNPKRYDCKPAWGDKVPLFLLKLSKYVFPSHIMILKVTEDL